jgi:hypothetical protein
VFDPRGGYFKAGGVYMPSIVAELGNIIETHLTAIGLLKGAELSDAQKQLIAEKRAAYERKSAKKKPEISTTNETGGAKVGEDTGEYAVPAAAQPNSSSNESAGTFPPGAMMCGKCNTQALVLLDGCQTCLNCGYSKCG